MACSQQRMPKNIQQNFAPFLQKTSTSPFVTSVHSYRIQFSSKSLPSPPWRKMGLSNGSGSCARAYVIKSPLLALVAAQCDKTRLYMKVKMRRCAFDWMDLGMPGWWGCGPLFFKSLKHVCVLHYVVLGFAKTGSDVTNVFSNLGPAGVKIRTFL